MRSTISPQNAVSVIWASTSTISISSKRCFFDSRAAWARTSLVSVLTVISSRARGVWSVMRCGLRNGQFSRSGGSLAAARRGRQAAYSAGATALSAARSAFFPARFSRTPTVIDIIGGTTAMVRRRKATARRAPPIRARDRARNRRRGEYQRQHSEDRRQGRHEDRPDTAVGRRLDRSAGRHAVAADVVQRLMDQQNRVVDDDADQYDESQHGQHVERLGDVEIEDRQPREPARRRRSAPTRGRSAGRRSSRTEPPSPNRR